jgi:hypothetical protein
MRSRHLRNAALLALVTTGLVLVSLPRPEHAVANPVPPFNDQDQDLLPDAVERMLLTDPTHPDSDRDGIGDFLDAVQHRQLEWNLPGVRRHEMRAAVTVERTRDGQKHVVANFLLRLVGQPTIHALVPFLHTNSFELPIAPLLGSGGMVHFAQRFDPLEGTLIIASARLCSLADLRRVLPCTIGVRAMIDDRLIERGTFLTSVEGVPVSLVPYKTGDFVLQNLSLDDPDDPFWATSRACELTLSVQGQGAAGMICEITKAECIGVPTMSCAPSCSTMAGGIIIVPSGLETLRGGG